MLHRVASFIQSGLDIILPRKDRVMRIDRYTLEDIPLSPVEHEMLGTRIVTLLNYQDEIVQDLIKTLKYDRSGQAARLLAGALAEYLREEVANLKAFSTKPVVLVPVPLHHTRERERGFNQIELVLQNLPLEFKNGEVSSVNTTHLIRIRATPQQTRLSRNERLKNVEGAFALTNDFPDAHIILIDDVTTTGATLCEAAKPLRRDNLMLLALAHA